MTGELLEQGLADFNQGDLEGAGRCAKRLLLTNPNDWDARHLWFAVLQAQGRIDEARVAGRVLLGSRPDDLHTRVALARCELSCGSAEAAIVLLEDREITDRAARAVLALAYEQVGRPTMARALRMTIPAGRDEGFYSERRAYFAQQLIDMVSREAGSEGQLLIRALDEGRYGDAGELIVQWLRLVGEDVAAVALADWLLLMDELDDVERVMAKCRSFDLLASVENRLGDVAQLRGNLVEARYHYRRAVLIEPTDYNAWLDLVRTEFLAGSKTEAIRICKELVAKDTPADVCSVADGFLRELASETTGRAPIGLYGLVWHEKGGALLSMQLKLSPGDPGVLVTGNVGRGLEESARIAHDVLSSTEGSLMTQRVHLHFPAFGIAKDGGSAGLAIAALILAAVRDIHIDRRVALTGELDLHGNVHPVGGLREKITAAHLMGIDHVFYPARNQGDLLEVPLLVRRTMILQGVEHLDQVAEALSK